VRWPTASADTEFNRRPSGPIGRQGPHIRAGKILGNIRIVRCVRILRAAATLRMNWRDSDGYDTELPA
jgi:hypothetical protein